MLRRPRISFLIDMAMVKSEGTCSGPTRMRFPITH